MEERKIILCSHFILGGHFLLKCDSQCKTTVWFELLWRTWTLGLAFSLSADIIQPKHLPSALLYLSIVLFWLLSHLCLLYCCESEIDHSHLSFTSINVVRNLAYWPYVQVLHNTDDIELFLPIEWPLKDIWDNTNFYIQCCILEQKCVGGVQKLGLRFSTTIRVNARVLKKRILKCTHIRDKKELNTNFLHCFKVPNIFRKDDRKICLKP